MRELNREPKPKKRSKKHAAQVNRPGTSKETCEDEKMKASCGVSQGGVIAIRPKIPVEIGGVNLNRSIASQSTEPNADPAQDLKKRKVDEHAKYFEEPADHSRGGERDCGNTARDRSTDPEVDPAQEHSGTAASSSSGPSTSSLNIGLAPCGPLFNAEVRIAEEDPSSLKK